MALFGRKSYTGVDRGDIGQMSPELSGMFEPIGNYAPAKVPDAPQINHPFLSRQGGVGAIAGTIGDFLLQQSGMNPVYAPRMEEQRGQQHDVALMQARQRMAAEQAAMQRQQENEDWMAREQWKRENPGNTALQQNFNWYKGLPEEDRGLVAPMLPGFQYTTQGIDAATRRAGSVANAQGAARAAHRTPSGGGGGQFEYRMGPNGQLQKRRVR